MSLPEKTTDFNLEINMDSAVVGMTPTVGLNANLIVTGDRKLIIKPNGSADLKNRTLRLDIDFDLKVSFAVIKNIKK